ncbi:hypothetical protein RLEG12_23095 [Rhizobium leguminosarum bv. trifolii CB782]|nr:hypothetical protein RLEG12_23095 [Rhizobium leguminosarum bv. trifolii CB782]
MDFRLTRRARPREIGLPLPHRERVQVDPILVDHTKFGQALGELRSGDFDLPNFTQALW